MSYRTCALCGRTVPGTEINIKSLQTYICSSCRAPIIEPTSAKKRKNYKRIALIEAQNRKDTTKLKNVKAEIIIQKVEELPYSVFMSVKGLKPQTKDSRYISLIKRLRKKGNDTDSSINSINTEN